MCRWFAFRASAKSVYRGSTDRNTQHQQPKFGRPYPGADKEGFF